MTEKSAAHGNTSRAQAHQSDLIIADPHVVYYDAVLNSPWNESGGTNLPSRDDWSTYRCASKDIIVGIVTHRYNRQTRRLEIRAYFIGEHPVFQAMEPTKIMMIVLCSQAYQSGGSMELHFEQGIPFDVRYLIEERLDIRVSGHDQTIQADLAQALYANLSSFSVEEQQRITAEKVPLELVCFNTYRGTWSSDIIKTLLQRGIPLRWIFRNRPSPIGQPIVHSHLFNHLRIAMMEEYAIHRLGDRKLGISAGKRVRRVDTPEAVYYVCDHALVLPDPYESGAFEADSFVFLEPQQPFCLTPVLSRAGDMLSVHLSRDIARVAAQAAFGASILVVPLDFTYLPESIRAAYVARVRQAKLGLLVVGLTVAQLLSEAEFNLAVTAAQLDDDEVETNNANRYAD